MGASNNMPDNRTPLYGIISSLLGPTQAADEEYQAAINALAVEQSKVPPMQRRLRELEIKVVYGGGPATTAEKMEYAGLGDQLSAQQALCSQMFSHNLELNQKWDELSERLIAASTALRR